MVVRQKVGSHSEIAQPTLQFTPSLPLNLFQTDTLLVLHINNFILKIFCL